MVEEGTFVSEFGTLKGAMPVFQRTHSAVLPVLRVAGKEQPAQIIGLLYEVDALRAYAKALADTAAEEHS
jgi:CIC family chloride channel protein